MRMKTINKLCCPFDKADLQLKIFVKDTNLNVLEGILSCSACQRNYPIVHGVPIMSPDEYRQIKLEQPIIENWKIEHGLEEIRLIPGQIDQN